MPSKPSGEDHKLNRFHEGFTSLKELQDRLVELADEEWYANVPFDGGQALFRSDSYGLVDHLIGDHGIDAFFERIASPAEGDAIYSAKEHLIPGAGLIIQEDFTQINEELIHYLASHPRLLQKRAPEKFEELIAELLKDKGYDVERTKSTRDGGFDLRVLKRSDLGTFLTLAECKRYAPNNKVSVGIVRGLFGVVSSQGATSGLVVTTSTFTRDATNFQQQNQHRMALADIEVLKCWLKEHGMTRI